MMKLYCDESHDDHSYALAGWACTPTHSEILEREWKAMLGTIEMPNGATCPAFYASAIMNQRGPFKGWGYDQARAAFTKATDVIARNRSFAIWPMGVAAEIPVTFTDVMRDSVWLILFTHFFQMVMETHPAAQGVEFVFDEKREIASHARTLYGTVTEAIRHTHAGVFESVIRFENDVVFAQLQAADLLVYEWRKRISDGRTSPEKPPRPWFDRMRSARPNGALWRYGREVFEEALKADDQSATWARAVMYGQPTHRD